MSKKNKNQENYPCRVFKSSLALLSAIFIAIVSIMYILYRGWSAKAEIEKWKDYDECGI